MRFLRSLYELVFSQDTAKELLKLAIGGLIAAVCAVVAFQLSATDQDIHADMRLALEAHVAHKLSDEGEVQSDINWPDAKYLETDNPNLKVVTGIGQFWRDPSQKHRMIFFALFNMHRAGIYDHYLRGKDKLAVVEIVGMFESGDFRFSLDYQKLDDRELFLATAFGSYRSPAGDFQTASILAMLTRKDGKWILSVCPREGNPWSAASAPVSFYWFDQTGRGTVEAILKYDAEYQLKKSEHRLFEFATTNKTIAWDSGANFEATVWSVRDGTCAEDADWNGGEVLRIKGPELVPTGTPTLQEIMERAYQRGLDVQAKILLGRNR